MGVDFSSTGRSSWIKNSSGYRVIILSLDVPAWDIWSQESCYRWLPYVIWPAVKPPEDKMSKLTTSVTTWAPCSHVRLTSITLMNSKISCELAGQHSVRAPSPGEPDFLSWTADSLSSNQKLLIPKQHNRLPKLCLTEPNRTVKILSLLTWLQNQPHYL